MKDKPLSKEQRIFLENQLLPYATDVGYNTTIKTIQQILRAGRYWVLQALYLNSVVEEYKEWKNWKEYHSHKPPNRIIMVNGPWKKTLKVALPYAREVPFRNRELSKFVRTILKEGKFNEKQEFVINRLWRKSFEHDKWK